MPTISKIRFTNVVYEDRMKRYNNEVFKFDGYNGAVILENGGGKTVFIQTALQAIIPHTNLADRKIKQTLQLDNYPAHIAIEWILSENPRRYLVTCVSLFLIKEDLGSYRYVYQYPAGDTNSIEHIPFVKKDFNRPADRGEISDYYQQMTSKHMNAHTFPTIKEFQQFIEEQYGIVANEWDSIVKINSTEGGVEAFFDECKQTNQLFDRLLIPTVESAISGHDQNTFADIFEKHRSSFKLYKELKEQIEENKAIEEELNRYVLTYGDLHEKQQVYEQSKQRAKAVLNLIQRQEQEYKEALNAIEAKMEDWNAEDRCHNKKSLSLEIFKERTLFKQHQGELQEYEQKYNSDSEELHQATKQFYSLKYAELKKNQMEAQGLILSLQKRLEELEQDEDIDDIKNTLDENSQELKGYFLHEFEESNKRQQGYKVQKQPIMEQIEQFNKQKKSFEEQLDKVKEGFYSNKGQIETRNGQVAKIKKRILSNPEQESVKEEVPVWEKRLGYLDEQMVQLLEHNKQLTKMIAECNEQKEIITKEKEVKEEKRIKMALAIEQIETEHSNIKEELGKLRLQWASLDSIYLRQDSITQQIHDNRKRLHREHENCLYKERLARRFLDDYGTQDLFFADPFVEKHLQQWSDQFNLLETGVHFIQSLEDDDNVTEEIKKYPFWPIILITTESEREKLRLKLKSIDKELQFPIEVITLEEARAIAKGDKTESPSIAPNHWLQNQHSSTLFQEWKETIAFQAEEATKTREESVEKINAWNRGAEKLANFLQNYPYEEYQVRKDDLNTLLNQIQKLLAEQEEIHLNLTEYEERLTAQRETIDLYRQKHTGLQGKLESAYEYLQIEKEMLDLLIVQEQFSKQIKENENSLNRVDSQIRRFEEEKRHLEYQERDENQYINRLMDDELYLEVKSFSPKYTDKTKNVLEHERTELKLALRELSSNRNEILLNLNHANKDLSRMAKEMSEMLLDYGPLNEKLLFPPNGYEQIESYRNKVKELEKVVKEADQRFNEKNVEKSRQEKVLELVTSKFHEEFTDEDPVSFNEPLSIVQDKISDERMQLKEQHEYLEREQQRINIEYDSIKGAFHELDRFEEAHHFKGPSVTARALLEEDIQTFTYERMNFVQNVTAELKEGKTKVSKEWEKVDRAKESFKSFCKNNITNVKMREMARQGIDNKHTFKEVVEFQTHMQKRIQTAIKYNEASIINHDKQLEQFVTHINGHLLTIAGELKLIPRMTRIKVGEIWKDIYKFSIPEWTEEEGKNRIRKHIEWVLNQLESDRFISVEGTEDSGKVRKEIETWLQSKQLLRVVMNHEMMKVTCRKVTNDNEVTTRSYSWEQSNVWSGGEKWSKNMTLFLGILNYVAEKQKHDDSNMKRHRVVILDNPFGKASSDHVLNPVFFIAEQLGFQIIALTAHAEGKFLRDYFPVIYSCRLRKAADSNKQIMTKVKHLHQAYFQDHEPQALERLGEMVQMELF